MIRLLSSLFLALLCSSLCGEPFIISEIFGHPRGHEHGKEWIEIAHVPERPLLINSVGLEISDSKNREIIFKKDISLSTPIRLVDYLLIAQEKNLGLGQCLNDDMAVVVMPGFALSNESDRTICVEINGGQKTCAKIGKKIKMLNGTSLFRDVNDGNEEPLWRQEPCHLMGNIFASPGLKARFCGTVIPKSLFQRCDYLQEITVSKLSLNQHEALIISPNHVETLEHNNLSITVALKEVTDSPLFMRLCARPLGSKKICHLLVDDQYMGPQKSHEFSMATWHQDMGESLFLTIRDLKGRIGTLNVGQRKQNNQPTWKMKRFTQDGSDAIKLDLKADELPLNVAVLTDNGLVILQRSFVSPGEKTIDVPNDHAHQSVTVKISGARGNYSFLLPDREP